MIMWFEFDGSIQIACTSSCVDAAMSVWTVLPLSLEKCRPTVEPNTPWAAAFAQRTIPRESVIHVGMGSWSSAGMIVVA